MKGQGKDFTLDLTDLATGEIVPKTTQVQMKAIKGMDYDWSVVVDRKTGKQLQTVGSHWPKSRPLDADMRKTMEKTGLCMGCHQNMSNKELWNKVNTKPKLDLQEHIKKMNELLNKATK